MFKRGEAPLPNILPLPRGIKVTAGGVIEEMSLRGAERRSKLKDKDEIASPSARNDTSGRRGRGIKGEGY